MKDPGRDNPISYRTPIYLQLREIVRSKIDDGEYLPGTAIPSENELAETYGIHRITVRNALDALVNEGILCRVQGKGMFVVGQKMEQSIAGPRGFISSVSSDKTTVKEVAKSLRPAGEKFANLFKVNTEDNIFYVKQIISLEGEPIFHEEFYVPQDVVPQLDIVNSTVFSMKDIFPFYGVAVASARQSLEIVEPGTKIRHMLNAPEKVAIMMMDGTYEDASGRTIEYYRTYARSDKVSFKVQLYDL